MSETKYTPGPWIREGRTVYALGELPHRWVDGKPIQANRMHVHVDGTRKLTAEEEYEANACLIAAAPELLEALKAAYKEMRLYLQRPAKSTTLQRIKAAIDKAEGRNE